MTLYHYCNTTYNTGSRGGVARFDYELKKAFPDIISLLPHMKADFGYMTPEDVVITDNGMCLDIPQVVTCIVVHHGSAIVHKEREPDWPGDGYVRGQLRMANRPNNIYVAPSFFMKNAFGKLGVDPILLLHSSDLRPTTKVKNNKPVVLGDWRDFNKGRDVIPRLQESRPDLEFRQLKCGVENASKEAAYAEADAYLTLSLSEGCSYSQLDALACGVPVVSTDVSLFAGDCDNRCGISIPWESRDDLDIVNDALDRIFSGAWSPRDWLDECNNFDTWKSLWKDVVYDTRRL